MPHGTLPGRDTPWGRGEGQFTNGPGLWLDAVLPNRSHPVRFYLQGLAAWSSVEWSHQGGQGVAGLVGSAVGGVEVGLSGGSMRPFLRLGFGANLFGVYTDGFCLEDRSCGLAQEYAGNHFDPAVQGGAGVEVTLGGRRLVVGLNGVWSEFGIRDAATSQRYLSLGLGLGL